MLARYGSINFLRFLSGVYGIVSLFLPWLVLESEGQILTLTLFLNQWSDYYHPHYTPVLFSVLLQISAVLAFALAIMILGCFTAFLSTFIPGMKGRVFALSAGISFCLAPTILLFGFIFLFDSVGGLRTAFSTSLFPGFFMAFVAAVPAFVSLSNLRRTMTFLFAWAVFLIVLFRIFLFAYHWHGEQYHVLIWPSLIFSLIATSLSTLVYGIIAGIVKLLKKK